MVDGNKHWSLFHFLCHLDCFPIHLQVLGKFSKYCFLFGGHEQIKHWVGLVSHRQLPVSANWHLCLGGRRGEIFGWDFSRTLVLEMSKIVSI